MHSANVYALTLLCAATWVIGAAGFTREPQERHIPPPRDPSALGTGVERTVGMLASSTASRRNTVRILFYGQSITEQNWWRLVADDLRRRFPHADLQIENRAIGGFASQMLVMPAEHDIYPFFPDLVIFHVYGADKEYEEIIRGIRTRTAAEVLMQRDHVTRWPPEHPDEQVDKGLWWDHRMNETVLPQIAERYGCGLVDVRGGWIDYLRTHKLEPAALLKDDVHLNDEGCRLMAALVGRHLVVRRPAARSDLAAVRELVVGRDIHWKGGRLVAEFTGVRVDAISARRGAEPVSAVQALVDGRKPSDLPEAYCFTRPAPPPWSPLFIARVDHDRPLVAEDWTLTITSVSNDGKRWTFDVVGSATGPDGSGASDAPFVSRSGRVRIDPRAHFNSYGSSTPTVGYRCTWQAVLLGSDTMVLPQAGTDGREAAIRIVQGLANRKHRLELVSSSGKPAPVAALRVYSPALK